MSTLPLITCQSISKSFGIRSLFRDLSLSIHEGERIGLIGPNGSGKTTLIRILADRESPDSGTVSRRKESRIGFVPQERTFPPSRTPSGILLDALADIRLPDLDTGYQREAWVAETLSRCGFTEQDTPAERLSGGWRRRLALAEALVRRPDLLLLDEPTNHLDLDALLWLERFLQGTSIGYLVVSHDRTFLENTVTRMLEIDRRYPGGIFSVNGSYSMFLEKKDQMLSGLDRNRESLANRVGNELDWLRHGPKARTGKDRFRKEEAARLIKELADLDQRLHNQSADIRFSASERKSRRLLVARHLGKSFDARHLFRDVNLLLSPGTRLGLVGANGSGKTTLLRLLTGDLSPDHGEIQRIDHLKIVYFDQDRSRLDPDQSLRQALTGDNGDLVIFGGQPMHVTAWAKRFLFQVEQLDMPVHRLSGGEQARVLIARLMLQPADVLLLDEPTNDLDIPTLEILEESLTAFPGALVLVTHDRYLMDQVCTSLLALDGRGGSAILADYVQWEEFRRSRQPRESRDPSTPSARRRAPKALSYREQKEYDQIEERIQTAEAEVRNLEEEMADPAVVADAPRLLELHNRLDTARREVDTLYERWSELEAKKENGSA